LDNQHKHIKGYRDLSESDIELINEIKAAGEQLRHLIAALKALGPHLDQRWIAEGNTDLQKGIMCLVRGVAQPESF
jgi:hypothetical protein